MAKGKRNRNGNGNADGQGKAARRLARLYEEIVNAAEQATGVAADQVRPLAEIAARTDSIAETL